MQDKSIKDLTIAIGVIVIIILSIRVWVLYNKVNKIPLESRHRNMKLSPELEAQIKQIEDSINERKNFRFTVRRDPLKQNFIVQTRMDMLADWEAMVRRMMRLAAILTDEITGEKRAIIAFGGKNNPVLVGDVLNNKRFTQFTDDRAYFTENGATGYLILAPEPPKPPELQNTRNQNNTNR